MDVYGEAAIKDGAEDDPQAWWLPRPALFDEVVASDASNCPSDEPLNRGTIDQILMVIKVEAETVLFGGPGQVNDDNSKWNFVFVWLHDWNWLNKGICNSLSLVRMLILNNISR